MPARFCSFTDGKGAGRRWPPSSRPWPEVLDEVIPFVADGAPGDEAKACPLANAIETDLFYRDLRW